jgi:hypothetical protein
MLKNEDFAYCNQRAEESRRMALRETDPKLKLVYSEMEDRWLRLASSCSFPQSANALRDGAVA